MFPLADRFSFMLSSDAAGPSLAAEIRRGSGFGFTSFAGHLGVATDPRVPPALRETDARWSVGFASSPDPRTEEGFASKHTVGSVQDAGREGALAALVDQIDAARAAGVRRVVVRPGAVPVDRGPVRHAELEDRARSGEAPDADGVAALESHRREYAEATLDRTCRSLFALCRRFPDVTFALPPARTYYEVPRLDEIELILSDVGATNLGYWHVPGTCRSLEAMGLDSQQSWLERNADRIVGLSFHDAHPGAPVLVPGDGDVDLSMLAFYVPRSAEVTLDVRPEWGDAGVQHAIQVMDTSGMLAASG